MDPLPRLEDDGLLAPEVGDWAEEKYQHVQYYATLFSRGMKHLWPSRAYVDLFAGAGRSRIRNTSSILPASPTIALDLPFTRYIFCDQDAAKLEVLEKRAHRDFPAAAPTARFLPGDVNENTDAILEALRFSKDDKLLTFCGVDPYALSNLRFETIRRLAQERMVDFLVLVPSGQDFQRFLNERHLPPEGMATEQFLGDPAWREKWAEFPHRTRANGAAEFIADRFGQEMRSLGYKYRGLDVARVVHSTEKNLLLYHLLLFSRHDLGEEFWKTTRDRVDPQRRLF